MHVRAHRGAVFSEKSNVLVFFFCFRSFRRESKRWKQQEKDKQHLKDKKSISLSLEGRIKENKKLYSNLRDKYPLS